jgi:chromate transporter
MQLATYAGWRLHGTLGGLIAGLLFVLPGAFVVLVLAAIYATVGDAPLVEGLFLGVKACVLIIVIEALLRISKRALKGTLAWVIAALAFVGIFLLALPYPLIVLVAAVVGFLTARKAEATPVRVSASPLATLRTILIWFVIWWAPLGLMMLVGGAPILTEIGLFFSKLAVVTFGGAYAVLAYMAQDVVTAFGWLEPGEMMDGLGLAETTPGPLILVTEFVGFLTAFKAGGLWLGVAGAVVALWVTFAPCFLWIFAGAPYIEWISSKARLAGALSAITAAVVGVILNLSVWFALHVVFADVSRAQAGPLVLWTPDLASFDWRVAVLAAVSALLLLHRHWGVAKVLAISALGGLALSMI